MNQKTEPSRQTYSAKEMKANRKFEDDIMENFQRSYNSDALNRMQFQADYEVLLTAFSQWLEKANKEQVKVIGNMVVSLNRMSIAKQQRDTEYYRVRAELTAERHLHIQSLKDLQRFKDFIKDEKVNTKFNQFLSYYNG